MLLIRNSQQKDGCPLPQKREKKEERRQGKGQVRGKDTYEVGRGTRNLVQRYLYKMNTYG